MERYIDELDDNVNAQRDQEHEDIMQQLEAMKESIETIR